MGSEPLTPAQQELLDWLTEYIQSNHHSPSIRQMMNAMGLRSPAPIQSRLKHLQDKGWITWKEGHARTLQLIEKTFSGIPLLGAVAAGGLVETFDDVQETLDMNSIIKKRDVFALVVNGDSMVDAYIADGDVVLMEPVYEPNSIRNGTVVSALVPGAGTTLKYFYRKGSLVTLEAANPEYEPIQIDAEMVQLQGKLLAVWRKA